MTHNTTTQATEQRARIETILERIVRDEVHASASMLMQRLAYADVCEALGVDVDDLIDIQEGPADYSECPDGYRAVTYGNGDWFMITDEGESSGIYETERDAIKAAWEDSGDEPPHHEVMEHWIVSDWLAEKLEAVGAAVAHDVLGFAIWGRTETGQSLNQDSDLMAVAAELADV